MDAAVGSEAVDTQSRFAALVGRAGPAVPLDEAALCIAAAGRGDGAPTDIDEQLARLDRLAELCPTPSVEGICWLLYSHLGLRGARGDYDDPRHSFLDQVLDRQLGIPISLAVIAIEIGRRVGVQLEGVGMPGHFLVGDPAHPDSYLDVFHEGRRLDTGQCRAMYQQGFGAQAPWSPDLLSAVSSHSILARMLANLTGSYRARDDMAGRLWVARFRAAVPGRPVAEQAALADELAQVGCFDLAAGLLEGAAGDDPTPPASRLRERSRALRARLN
jgi:regulator of sirC expression with transglutaminase-like and TPR domain